MVEVKVEVEEGVEDVVSARGRGGGIGKCIFNVVSFMVGTLRDSRLSKESELVLDLDLKNFAYSSGNGCYHKLTFNDFQVSG